MKLIRTLLRLKFYVALIGAGYLMHSCVNNDYRYRVSRIGTTPYLVDTENNQQEIIQQAHFQLGSTEYRIRNLYHESDLQRVVERLEKEMEAKK